MDELSMILTRLLLGIGHLAIIIVVAPLLQGFIKKQGFLADEARPTPSSTLPRFKKINAKGGIGLRTCLLGFSSGAKNRSSSHINGRACYSHCLGLGAVKWLGGPLFVRGKPWFGTLVYDAFGFRRGRNVWRNGLE